MLDKLGRTDPELLVDFDRLDHKGDGPGQPEQEGHALDDQPVAQEAVGVDGAHADMVAAETSIEDGADTTERLSASGKKTAAVLWVNMTAAWAIDSPTAARTSPIRNQRRGKM